MGVGGRAKWVRCLEMVISHKHGPGLYLKKIQQLYTAKIKFFVQTIQRYPQFLYSLHKVFQFLLILSLRN